MLELMYIMRVRNLMKKNKTYKEKQKLMKEEKQIFLKQHKR